MKIQLMLRVIEDSGGEFYIPVSNEYDLEEFRKVIQQPVEAPPPPPPKPKSYDIIANPEKLGELLQAVRQKDIQPKLFTDETGQIHLSFVTEKIFQLEKAKEKGYVLDYVVKEVEGA